MGGRVGVTLSHFHSDEWARRPQLPSLCLCGAESCYGIAGNSPRPPPPPRASVDCVDRYVTLRGSMASDVPGLDFAAHATCFGGGDGGCCPRTRTDRPC